MRSSLSILLAGACFVLLVDFLFYRVTRASSCWRRARWLYWGVSLLFVTGIACYHVAMPGARGPGIYFWAGRGVLLLLLYYVPRCVYLAVILPGSWLPCRRWVKRVARVAAGLSLAVLLHGTTVGRYQHEIVEVKVVIPGLPGAFDGLRVVQLSDLHLGSLGESYPGIRRLVREVNALEADVVVVTGDVVNNFAREILPWSEELRGIRARLGKFAVTGNHDHGDYTRWPSAGAKEANTRDFLENMEGCGFRVLNDASYPLAIGEDTLYVCGVQNWRKPPLPSYGNVEKALRGTAGHVVVLLAHDPSCWREEVVARYPVALTLSGHTHAMQVGFRIGRYTWTPARYFFPEYNGLYSRDGKQLYVSRGVGYLGIPGRIGMGPEITLLHLTNSYRK